MASQIEDKDQMQQDLLPFGPLGQKLTFPRLTISHSIFCQCPDHLHSFLSSMSLRCDHTYHKFSFQLP